MGEAEDDVASCILVEMRKQLLDAEPEDHSQPGIVGLEQDADAMNLLDVGDMAEDAVEVFLVLLDAPGVSNTRSVNNVDTFVHEKKAMCGRLLSCGLSIFKVLIVGRCPNVDVLALPGVCGEGELGWDRCDHLVIVMFQFSLPDLYICTCSESEAD